MTQRKVAAPTSAKSKLTDQDKKDEKQFLKIMGFVTIGLLALLFIIFVVSK